MASAKSTGPSSASFGVLILTLRIFVVLLSVAMILLNAWFLYYMDRLERDGCKCAQGWKRSFIQFSLMVFIALAVLSYFVNVRGGKWFGIGLMLQAITIAYVLVTREFIHDIKEDHCLCAETPAFKVLNFVNIVQLLILGVSILYAFYILVRIALSKSDGK